MAIVRDRRRRRGGEASAARDARALGIMMLYSALAKLWANRLEKK